MRAEMGRAGRKKILRRAAATGVLAALLLGLVAGVVLPARAKSAERAAPAGASLEPAKPSEALCFPLGTTAFRVSDAYGWRADPFTGAEAFHRGVDLACAEGTPVLAALGGTVTAARRSGTYGNYLRISHPGGPETVYAHMQYLYVRAGEVVASRRNGRSSFAENLNAKNRKTTEKGRKEAPFGLFERMLRQDRTIWQERSVRGPVPR